MCVYIYIPKGDDDSSAPAKEILIGKVQNGVSAHGFTANFVFFDRGTFWVLPLTYSYLPKSARCTFFPSLSKIITSAAAP